MTQGRSWVLIKFAIAKSSCNLLKIVEYHQHNQKNGHKTEVSWKVLFMNPYRAYSTKTFKNIPQYGELHSTTSQQHYSSFPNISTAYKAISMTKMPEIIKSSNTRKVKHSKIVHFFNKKVKITLYPHSCIITMYKQPIATLQVLPY